MAYPYHDEIVGNVKPAMLVTFAAVGFVLLIAFRVNVGNLRLPAQNHAITKWPFKAIGATLGIWRGNAWSKGYVWLCRGNRRSRRSP